MVEISFVDDRICLTVEGMDKLWALKRELKFPLSHIRGVRRDPEPARGLWHGLRLPGMQIPGVLTVGSFYQHGGMVFYDVHDPDGTIVIELDHEHYQRLIVEVADPAAAVRMIEARMAVPAP